MTTIRVLSPTEALTISPAQSGFAHGYALFETIRVRAQKVCFLREHFERLAHSAGALGFTFELDLESVLDAIRTCCKRADLVDGLVKLSLLTNGANSDLLVYSRALATVPTAARLYLESRYPQNEHSLLAGHKTHNYMENMVLYRKANGAGFYDCLRVNTQGHLTETCIGNLFYLSRDRLFTPELSCGVLPGVVRAAILQIVESGLLSMPLEVVHGQFFPSDLVGADAVFMTNSAVGCLPVEAIDLNGELHEYNSLKHPHLSALQVALADLERNTAL